MKLVPGNYLFCSGNGNSSTKVDRSRIRLKLSRNKMKNSAFAGAILAHQGYLRSSPHRKINLIQYGLIVSICERHLIKFQYYFSVIHVKLKIPAPKGRGSPNYIGRQKKISVTLQRLSFYVIKASQRTFVLFHPALSLGQVKKNEYSSPYL